MLKKTTKNKLEQESVGRLMFELCTQTTFSLLLYNVYIVTDTYFVSNGIEGIASGAIGVFSPFLILINGISSTLGTGSGSIISRRLGESSSSGGRSVVGCMIWIWGLCSLIITIFGLLFLEPLLILSGCTTEIAPYAIDYGRIMLAGTIFSTGFSGVMRAEGDIFYSTLQWCCPVMINLFLDPLFIYGFHMGISGAALATLAAQLFSAGNSIYYFFLRKKTPCRIRITDIRWDKYICREILSIGLPSFLSSFGGSFVGMAGNHLLGQVGGSEAISTFTIITRTQSLISTPFSGIMQGIQPMLGFDWGRGNKTRIKKTIRYAVYFAILYGSTAAFCIYYSADYIMRIFTNDIQILHMGAAALHIVCLPLIAGGFMPVVQAYLQALGQGREILLLSMGSIFLIRLPMLLIAGILGNLTAVWWILAFSDWMIAVWALYILSVRLNPL